MAHCGVNDHIMYEDPGIDISCLRGDPYNDYVATQEGIGSHTVRTMSKLQDVLQEKLLVTV